MMVFSGTTTVHGKKTAAGPEEITATVGGAAILFLLKLPEIEVLTLQMEHDANKNELS